MLANPRDVVIDFSDRNITSSGRMCFLWRMARHLDLLRELSRLPSLKLRRRGVPDAERTCR